MGEQGREVGAGEPSLGLHCAGDGPEQYWGWVAVTDKVWQHVASASTEELCWHLLEDWVPSVARGPGPVPDFAWSGVVLPAGRVPAEYRIVAGAPVPTRLPPESVPEKVAGHVNAGSGA